MKQHLKRLLVSIAAILAAIILIVTAWVSYVAIGTRCLSKNIDESYIDIFVPDGMADSYDEMLPFGGFGLDIQSTWSYKLSKNEIKEIETDISSGKWVKAAKDERSKIKDLVQSENVNQTPLSTELYYIAYDVKTGKKTNLDNISPLSYQIFVFDKKNSIYYCHLGID